MQEEYINICAACRKRAQLTQEHWAEVLRVSVETVKAWEGNRRIPDNYHAVSYTHLPIRPSGITTARSASTTTRPARSSAR